MEKLLKALRESHLSVPDISGITWIPVREMYEIFSGICDPPPSAKERIAKTLGKDVREIFP
jgi:hypothetical protein